ncbi:WD40 repeat-like protein [Caulochytrium protostelioides]|uniref:Pre-mRNA-processing factor 17 n=1 Tax=Caulochytrium protostelioides TaxID=1555241 RepID=A0A4P9WXC9_9FUNG|nr:WD40 repeat-like protein [Caulochytrium protostelioides]
MVHCWTGHTKAVTAMEWFPGTAHLLLTSSMDSQIKLWDVYRRRGCLRTFVGHTRGVKDISFRSDGLFFLSEGHDRWIKQWDTVTGQCTARWQTKRITNMVRYHPNNPHQFFAACDDGAVHQMDVRTGQTVQSYDQHQAAVNTITFIDEGRRFVTTSSDKAVRLWEMDIPVVIKYVADPAMHSIPAMATRPGGSALIGQSLDNQIVVFQAGKDRFRMNRKKAFKGHLVAGYACVPGFAPDGRYVVSGDSEGQIWFWDWAQGRHLKTLRAHDGVVSKVLWHPHEASHLASCSWDGTIKYWA